nr:MAG TPA: hypothetical protein [Caudoviricetes sp.]
MIKNKLYRRHTPLVQDICPVLGVFHLCRILKHREKYA